MHTYTRFYIILFFFVMIPFYKGQTNTLNKEKDMILWSSKKLTWNDFQGPPKKIKGETIAETHGRIMLEGTSSNKDVPKLLVKCFFMKKKSWTIVDDLDTLEHEQLHFDLYEFYTRNIRRAFKVLNNQGEKRFSKYKEVFNYYTKENDKMNSQYDSEVYGNLEKQKEWLDRISLALQKTKKFELK